MRLPRALPNIGLWALVHNRDLRRLEVASVLWNAAEQVYLVGLLVYAYAVGGAGTVALVGILQSLPLVVLLPVALRATSSMRTERLLRGLLAVRTVSIASAAILLATGGPAGLVFVIGSLDALAASVVRPTRAALVPRLARAPQELVTANVSISTGRSLAALVGPAIAALLLAVQDVTATFGLAAGLFGVALAITLAVRPAATLPRIRRTRETDESGLDVLRRDPHPRAVVAVLAGQQVVRGMLPVLVVALAVDLLRAGDQAVGILNSAIGLGALTGSALAIALLRKLRLAVTLLLAILVSSIGLAAPGLVPTLAVAVVAFALGGVGKSLVEVSGITLLQRAVSPLHRASVFGMLEAIATVSLATGSILAAVLIGTVGPAAALVVAGAIPVAVAVLAWPGLRSVGEEGSVLQGYIQLIRDVPMLKPLSLCTTEELAESVTRVRFQPGEVVIRQGDPGDCFYILERGEMETLVDGRPVRLLGAGDSFGEIALLRDVPRTATVRALQTSVVVVLARDHFLAAVTGRPEASAAAEEVIRGRLGA